MANNPKAKHLLGHLEKMVNVFLVALVALRSPHQPQLEDVIVAAALDDLVARVVTNIVVFVLLEQIVGAHLVRFDQQVLRIIAKRCEPIDSKQLEWAGARD